MNMPMKNTEADASVADGAYRVTQAELRQFVERFESLDSEKMEIAEQQKEVMAEFKGRGYDVPALRRIIARRKKDQAKLAEQDAVFELYREVLGL